MNTHFTVFWDGTDKTSRYLFCEPEVRREAPAAASNERTAWKWKPRSSALARQAKRDALYYFNKGEV
jgi:hypothetical protein